MEARRDVFQAIADATRRDILNLIAQEPQNMNAIAANFAVSRQAISLHMKILIECGLVEVRQEGNSRFCKARLEKLSEVHEWTARYKAFWTQNFDSLGRYLENQAKTGKKINKNQIQKKNGKSN